MTLTLSFSWRVEVNVSSTAPHSIAVNIDRTSVGENGPAVKSVSASSAVAKNSSNAACSVIDPNSF